jgi:threonine/homoserine/homoserine lactone efflux protein
VLVSRAKREVMRTRVARWVERTTGAVLIALGARVAFEQR